MLIVTYALNLIRTVTASDSVFAKIAVNGFYTFIAAAGVYGMFSGVDIWLSKLDQRNYIRLPDALVMLEPILNAVSDFASLTWHVGISIAANVFIVATAPISVPVLMIYAYPAKLNNSSASSPALKYSPVAAVITTVTVIIVSFLHSAKATAAATAATTAATAAATAVA